MQKTVERTVTTCDFCDSEEWASHKCKGCHKDLCRECCVHYSLYGYDGQFNLEDGYYCKECDANLAADPLHKAWVELKAFYKRKDAVMKVMYEKAQEYQNVILKLLGRTRR